MAEQWKKHLDEIGEAVELYNSYAPIMTQLELLQAQKQLSQMFEQHEGMIVNNVLGNWEHALGQTRAAFAAVQEAKRAEVRKWDAGKLNAEMQAIEAQIKNTISGQPEPDAVKQLKTMYSELANCGDPYKTRAAAEAFRSVMDHMKTDDGRMMANRIRTQASRDLEKTRANDATLQAAHSVAAETVEELNAARLEIVEADRKLAKTRPNGEIGNYDFYKALHRVETDDSGNIVKIDGENV